MRNDARANLGVTRSPVERQVQPMPLVHRPDFPVAAIHRQHGHVAFYVRRRPRLGDCLSVAQVCLPNGERPMIGTVLRCASCGQTIQWSAHTLDFVDVPIERAEA